MATFTGDPTEPNTITPGFISPGVVITPSGSALTGDDSLTGGASGDTLDGGAGNDTLSGGDGSDRLFGGPGDDRLNAGGFLDDGMPDFLSGGGGADRFVSLSRFDTAEGGGGDDVFEVFLAIGSQPARIDGGAGLDRIVSAGGGRANLFGIELIGVEGLASDAELTGAQVARFTRFGDTGAGQQVHRYKILSSGAAGTAADFTGRIADPLDRFEIDGENAFGKGDRIWFDPAATNPVLLRGFGGPDSLRGGAGADGLSGGDGRDTLDGGAGADFIDGAEGGGGFQADTLLGGAGDDTIAGAQDGDSVDGGAGDDRIFLSLDEGEAVTLSGGAGTDALEAAGSDLSLATISGMEVLESEARLRGAQLTGFALLRGSSFTITDATLADFTGRVGNPDTYIIEGVASASTGERIRFDAGLARSAIIRGYLGDDSLEGGGGLDQIRGDAGSDTLRGHGGADQLFAGTPFNAEADLLDGGAGGDSLNELGEGDTALGGAGNDLFRVAAGSVARIDGGAGTDALVAGDYDLSVTTIKGVENLADDARLRGDQLSAFAAIGTDSPLTGREYRYVVTDGAQVDLSGVVMQAVDSFALRADPDVTFANVWRHDPASLARIRLDAYDGDDSLAGGAGDDTLDGGDGADTLRGLGGDDRLDAGLVGDGADLLVGGAGDDELDGVSAGDVAQGGAGNDEFEVEGPGAATLDGGAGVDRLDADGENISAMRLTSIEQLEDDAVLTAAQAASFQTFGAGSRNRAEEIELELTTATVAVSFVSKLSDALDDYDILGANAATQGDRITFAANAANDLRLNGRGGSDLLRAGAGDDTVLGGTGDDTLQGGTGENRLDGGFGLDTISYRQSATGVAVSLASTLTQTVTAGTRDRLAGFENLEGSGLADSLGGAAGPNRLRGWAGSDTLSGGAGNDTLIGDAGNDRLTGGAGRDRFQIGPDGFQDRIFDFTDGSDWLVVSGFGRAFDTAAEVVAAADDAGPDIFIRLGTTRVIIQNFDLADFGVADVIIL